MPTDTRKSDLRIIKTEKVLKAALFSLLERHYFGKITVRDICEEAQISRATFYARFADKYDFLKNWLLILKSEVVETDGRYEGNEQKLNDFIYRHKAHINHLLTDADYETLGILSEFTVSILCLPEKNEATRKTPGQVTLLRFYAGGFIYYFQWLAKNKFPPGISPINTYLLKIIDLFREWLRDAG